MLGRVMMITKVQKLKFLPGGTELSGMASQFANSQQCLYHLSTSPKRFILLFTHVYACLVPLDHQGPHHSMTNFSLVNNPKKLT